MMINEGEYTEEQEQSRQHFNERSQYWYDIYQDYRSFTGYVLRKQGQIVIDRITSTAGAKCILDVGCGAGVIALELAHRGNEVSGIDIAPNMIERAYAEASRRGIQCDFQVGIAEELHYPDAQFDALIALGLLGNILDDRPVLCEMARVLKPGGRLLVTIPNLLALDMLVALPKSLPIMLGSTRLRRPIRQAGNVGRRLLGRPVKPLSTLRFNKCVIPHHYVQRLEQFGFQDVRYDPLTFGPLMPLGLRIKDDQAAVRVSERIARWVNRLKGFDWLGTVILFDARRV
jgi:2-polyprenyl-3-methyl-5-hydroxy-6-metoxy-1,4-benzoquinol methylase